MLILTVISLPAFAQTEGWLLEEQMIGSLQQGGEDTAVVKMWVSGNKFRREPLDSSEITLGRLDKGYFYMISPREKTYSKLDLVTMRELSAFTMAMMGAQVDDEGNVTVPADLYIRSGQKKKIRSWNAEKVTLNPKYAGKSMLENFSLWIASDTGIPPELYTDMMKMVLGNPSGETEKIFKLWKDFNGYPVMIEMSIMGMKQTTITTKIEKIAPDPSLFELPAGYKEVPNPMKEMFEHLQEN